MRPTPRKLALLMSIAGFGLSLSELAQANAASQPSRTTALGLEGLLSDSEGAGDPGAAATVASIPSGPLDATLSWHEKSAAMSAEDRAAVALAMVLMAEPSSSDDPTAVSEPAAPAPRWDLSEELLRQFRDSRSPGEPLGSAPNDEAASVSAAQDATAASPGPDASSPAVAQVDLDLGVGMTAAPAGAGGPDLDLNLDLWLAPVLDLNLDLGVGLDLNLDLATDVDLRLDRPPVFAVTRLKPLGGAGPAAEGAGSVARACTVDEPLAAFGDASTAGTAPMPMPASLHQASVLAEATPTAQARRADAGRTEALSGEAVAASVQPSVPAEAAAAPEAAAKVAPTIVVASHADRVLRSLEVLLANDDPAGAPAGARPVEVFVTSHAEKALLMLASTCAGEEAPLPDAERAPRLSKVEPAPSAACKPMASASPAARPARRSALGGDTVALASGTLDKVRGGFETSNGLQISFGIERAVYINGSLVTTTSLNVSDLGKVTGGSGAVASAVAGSGNLTLIQNGAGNTFVTGPVSAATVGTVVQNTLNDQKIQSVTAINATVNSLQMVRAQNFQSSLRGAVIDSLRR